MSDGPYTYDARGEDDRPAEPQPSRVCTCVWGVHIIIDRRPDCPIHSGEGDHG